MERSQVLVLVLGFTLTYRRTHFCYANASPDAPFNHILSTHPFIHLYPIPTLSLSFPLPFTLSMYAQICYRFKSENVEKVIRVPMGRIQGETEMVDLQEEGTPTKELPNVPKMRKQHCVIREH